MLSIIQSIISMILISTFIVMITANNGILSGSL